MVEESRENRTVKDLSPDEKATILAAIRAGAMNEDLVKTHNIQLQTAIALRAVTTRQDNAARTGSITSPVLPENTDTMKQFIEAYEALPSDPERTSAIEEVRKIYPASIAQLLHIAHELQNPPADSASTTITSEEKSKHDVNGETSSDKDEKIVETPDASKKDSGPVTSTVSIIGEQYENDTKARWFQEALAFTTSNSTPEWRKNAKVLTLAGPRCLRMPDWLRAGYREENIIAIEGGTEEEKALFSETMKKYPKARAVTDRLEKFLEREPGAYGVTDFDWTGPICDAYVEMCQNMECRFLLANVMAKRERPENSEILRRMVGISKTNSHPRLFEQLSRKFEAESTGKKYEADRASQAIDEIFEENKTAADETELSEARMNALSQILLVNVGTTAGARQYQDIIGSDLSFNGIALSSFYIKSTAHHFAKRLLEFVDSFRWVTKERECLACLPKMMQTGMYNTHRVRKLRKMKYQSEKSGSPYYSIFAELSPGIERMDLYQDVFNFCLDYIRTSIQRDRNAGTNYGLWKRSSLFSAGLKPPNAIGRGDEICFGKLPRAAKPSACIKLGKLFDQSIAFELWDRQYPLTSSEEQENVKWETLAKNE